MFLKIDFHTLDHFVKFILDFMQIQQHAKRIIIAMNELGGTSNDKSNGSKVRHRHHDESTVFFVEGKSRLLKTQNSE